MSDTPRCSALHRDALDSNDLRAWWKLAYELERGLTEAKKYWTLYFDECIEADVRLTQAQARCAEMRSALDRSRVAIDDWINTYASEMCDEGRVKEAYDRIGDAGGTLAYIADVQQANRAALKG